MTGLVLFGGLVGALLLLGLRRKTQIEQASFFQLMAEAQTAFASEDREVFCESLAEAQLRLSPQGPAITMPDDVAQQYQIAIMFDQSGISTAQLLSIASLLHSRGYDYEASQALKIAQEIHCNG